MNNCQYIGFRTGCETRPCLIIIHAIHYSAELDYHYRRGFNAYRAFTVEGEVIEREVSGLHARIVQHEFDHLQGIVFLERVKNPKTFGFYEELLKAGSI